MTINEDIIKGKWLEIKGEVQKTWGKLTDDEIEQTKGDAKSIAGLVQQKYGENKEKFEDQFSKIVASFQDKKNEAIETIKTNLNS